MPPKQKYTDPKLCDEVKEDVQQSDKGDRLANGLHVRYEDSSCSAFPLSLLRLVHCV